MNANGQLVGAPTTIVEDRWCYQFSSHGVGDLEILGDGTLLASSGEGAYWAGADYGQKGGIQQFPPVANLTPRNACGDPPNGVGGTVNAVTSEGGSFRSQDLLTPADPLTYDGSIIRINPDTGLAPAGNPLVGVGPTADDAVLGHGMRNPFRLTARPGTDEIYAVDVGAGRFEEINRLKTGDSVAENFGWPCKEGPEINRTFEALNSDMCDRVFGTGNPTTLTDPWFSYMRGGTGGAISGIAVVPPGRYDSNMVGDLIFSDYVQGRTWTIGIESDGSADDDGPEQVASEGVVVDLTAAPDGYLYTVDYYAGSVNRLVDKDAAPVARIAASPPQGQLPLTVALDASASAQPGGGALTFAWDLDDDGQFDDATGPTTSVTLTQAVNREVSVKVTNSANAFAVASTTVYPGNSAPTVTIAVSSPLPWTSDGDITFSVAANDLEDGVLPASSVSWNADLLHCYSPSDCHQHPFVGGTGSLGGTITGPSHGYPSFIRLTATATDSRGQTTVTSRDLHPASVTLQVTSNPPGAVVSIGDEQKVTPFTHTAIKNDSLTVAAQSPQTIAGQNYSFSSWSNGQPASHQYAATANATLTLNLSPTP
jgi:glucose/arabinose dehydrogenase